jgi:hypothetical protein
MQEKVYVDQVMAGEITVDHERQREINPHHVKHLRTNWDEAAVGVIYLSKRDDHLYHCMDGQNRVAAGKEIDPTIIFNALVIEGLTPERESELFIKFNEVRKNVLPYDKWQQHLGFQDPMYVALDNMLKERGLKVGRAASTNRVAAISKMTVLYKKYGIHTIDVTLATLGASWSRTADSWRSTVIGAVARLVYMNPRIDLEHLQATLGSNEPAVWDDMRSGTSNSTDGDLEIAKEIANRYNRKKRGGNRLIVDPTPDDAVDES